MMRIRGLHRYCCSFALPVLVLLITPVVWADEEAAAKLLAEATTLIQTGQAVPAFRLLSKARQTASNDNDNYTACAAQLGLALLRIELTEFNKASGHLEKAGRLAEELDDAALRARILNSRIKLDLYSTHYQRAADRLGNALELAEAADNPAIIVETLLLAADLAQRRGRLQQAADYIERAERRAVKLPADVINVHISAQRARLLAAQSQYSQALALWRPTLARYEVLGFVNASSDAINNIGEIQYALGLLQESKDSFTIALQRFRKASNYSGELRALINLGKVNLRLHAPAKTLETADKALSMSRQRHDYVAEAQALMQLGEVWLGEPIPDLPALPNPPTAIRHIKSAQEIYKDAGDRLGVLDTYLKLGKANALANRHRLAIKLFEHSQKLADEIHDDDALWRALHGEAASYAAGEDYQRAADKYAQAGIVLERVYSGTAGLSSELRSAFINDKREFFEEYLRVLFRLYQQDKNTQHLYKAFSVSEIARSRQFTEMLVSAGAERIAAKQDPALRDLLLRENTLKQSLKQLRYALYSSANINKTEQDLLQQQLRQVEAELTTLGDRLRREFPRYNELVKPQVVTVKDIQQSLHKDEILLSYFTTRNFLYAFIIGKQTFKTIPIRLKRSILRRAIDDFRQPFAQIRSFDDLIAWQPLAAADLYEQVFLPVEKDIKEGATVYIAADDALYTVPFEAMLRTKSKQITVQAAVAGKPLFSEFAKLDWLGNHLRTAYVPSGGALYSMRKVQTDKTVWSNNLLAFADPVFDENNSNASLQDSNRGLFSNAMSRATGVSGLARLPETADEVKAVSNIVGGTNVIHLREQANESRVYAANPIASRYVMFSTHGLLGGDFSALAEPALALSLVGNSAEVDGFLTMSEVLGLRMNSDLTVLSACNTAGEPQQARGGEGFAGLTRSFMFAGTRSLLVSHWPVGSQATVELMKNFFKHRTAGASKPLALSKARSELRSTVQGNIQLAHPFFWAPFVLVGDAR